MANGIDLKRLVKAVQRADQIVTPRYEQWLLRGQNFPVPEHIAERIKELMTTPPRNRSASFSASSAGTCKRAQVYGYLGVPQNQQVGAQLQAIFNNGTWTHLKLQVAFLMAGIIDDVYDIEYPLMWRRMRTRGTIDGQGVVPKNHPHHSWREKTFGLELKSANSRVFYPLKEEIMAPDGPLKYARQYTRYFTLGGFDLFVVFVENKDTNDTLEWVVEPNEKWMAEDREELKDLNWSVDHQRLPDRLPQCRALTGQTFRDCSYGTKTGACALLTRFRDAKKVGA